MTRADWAVVVIAILLLPPLYIHFWFPDTNPHQALVFSGSANPQWVSLDQPGTIEVQGKIGSSTLQIEEHKIRFLDSPCKGKVCVHGGWIDRAGEMLACLPNRVAVRLSGPDVRFDAINF